MMEFAGTSSLSYKVLFLHHAIIAYIYIIVILHSWSSYVAQFSRASCDLYNHCLPLLCRLPSPRPVPSNPIILDLPHSEFPGKVT